MDRLTNILVAVDFSDCSKAALAQAVRIARWNGARLHALHIIESLVVADMAAAMRVSQQEVSDQVCRQAQAKLAAWVQETGGTAQITVVVDTPLHEVLSQVRAVSADLLVAGARGCSAPIQGVGALAAKFARKAPTKVLLVSEGCTEPFRMVVACIDFSPASQLVVQQTLRVASREGSEIHCLHVFDPPWRRLHYGAPTPQATPNFERQYTAALQGRLDEFVGKHEGFNLRCVLFPMSSFGHGIAQYAKENHADLVIMGTRGQTSLRYLLLGSTAERLLRELPCSVLTVRAPGGENILPIP